MVGWVRVFGWAAWGLAGISPLAVAQGGPPAATASKARAAKPAFTVQLALTPDAEAFVQSWNRAKDAPQLDVTGTVRRGQRVSAMLLFTGCQTDKAGRCDVVASYALITPDGRRLALASGPIWSDVLPPGRLQLGRRSANLRFDASDPPGTYRVTAVVTDRHGQRSVEVVTPLKLN